MIGKHCALRTYTGTVLSYIVIACGDVMLWEILVPQVQQIEPMVNPVGALSVPSRDHQSSIFGGKSRTNITTIQALQLSPMNYH